MAGEAGRQAGGPTPDSEQSTVTPQPEVRPISGARNPNWTAGSSGNSSNHSNLIVHTNQAEDLVGYGREGDSEDGIQRPATSDGVVFTRSSDSQPLPGERHPVSADATIPIPLPSWQPSMAASSGHYLAPNVAAYRPQAQQSNHYQRMLAAKLAAAEEDPLASQTEENSYIPPSITQSDMAYLPSTYSPMYQMFSNGGGLDAQYQAQHTPQGGSGQTWNMHDQAHQGQPYISGSNDPSYLGLFKNHPSHNPAYQDHYANAQHQPGGPGWNPYYSPSGSDSRNPGAGPGQSSQWNRHEAKTEEIPPPAVDDWMAAWPHIKNPGHEAPKPAASTSRKKTDSEVRARKDGSASASNKDGDQPKKAALACHFCRGRKLK
jgi:hypothetical protein